MRYSNFNIALILLLILTVSACQSEYTKLVKNELASGKRNDSIFYNLRFGNTKTEFFKICKDLNRKHLVKQGPSNTNVQALFNPRDTSEVFQKIKMLFYGVFNSDNIMTGMDVEFSYEDWALWNKDLYADKLVPVVQDTLMKCFPGNPFMQVKGSLVKVDGNRQIVLKQKSERDVSVRIEDLEYKYKTLLK
jgi:hypothetical protein